MSAIRNALMASVAVALIASPAFAQSNVLRIGMLGGETIAINLGTGNGTTVKELIEAIEKVSGRPMPVKRTDRRPGDPPGLVASNALAREVLGWDPKHGIDDIIRSAWKWHSTFNGHSD